MLLECHATHYMDKAMIFTENLQPKTPWKESPCAWEIETTTLVDALTPTHLAQSLRFLKRECASPPLPNPTLPVQHLGSTLAQQLGLGASGTGATGSCHILARKSHISQPTAFLKRMKVLGYKFSDIDPVSSGCGTLFPLSSLMKYLLPLEMNSKIRGRSRSHPKHPLLCSPAPWLHLWKGCQVETSKGQTSWIWWFEDCT